MLAITTIGHFRLTKGFLVWDDPIEQRQTPLSSTALDELACLVRCREIHGNLVKANEDEYPNLLGMGILKKISSSSFDLESQILERWYNIPPLARDYCLASGIRRDRNVSTREEHHLHLREKTLVVGPPEHIWENMGLSSNVSLPTATNIVNSSFHEAMVSRRSSNFENRLSAAKIEDVSSILQYCAQFTDPDGRTSEQKEYSSYFRNAPSSGGLCSTEVIVRVRLCEGIQPGYYFYNPLKHSLLFLNELEDENTWLKTTGEQKHFRNASVYFIICGDPKVASWKYETLNTPRALLIEIGHVSQLALSAATALRYRSRVIAFFREDLLGRATTLERENLLWGVIVGVAPNSDSAEQPDSYSRLKQGKEQ